MSVDAFAFVMEDEDEASYRVRSKDVQVLLPTIRARLILEALDRYMMMICSGWEEDADVPGTQSARKGIWLSVEE